MGDIHAMSGLPLQADLRKNVITVCLRIAITGREQMQQTTLRQCGYSITSSARASSDGGTSTLTVLAVFRLIMNSKSCLDRCSRCRLRE
jgi:hypothetical protein